MAANGHKLDRVLLITSLSLIAIAAIIVGAVLATHNVATGACFAIATAAVGALGTIAVRWSK